MLIWSYNCPKSAWCSQEFSCLACPLSAEVRQKQQDASGICKTFFSLFTVSNLRSYFLFLFLFHFHSSSFFNGNGGRVYASPWSSPLEHKHLRTPTYYYTPASFTSRFSCWVIGEECGGGMLMAGRGGEAAQELYSVCQDERGAPQCGTLTPTLCVRTCVWCCCH